MLFCVIYNVYREGWWCFVLLITLIWRVGVVLFITVSGGLVLFCVCSVFFLPAVIWMNMFIWISDGQFGSYLTITFVHHSFFNKLFVFPCKLFPCYSSYIKHWGKNVLCVYVWIWISYSYKYQMFRNISCQKIDTKYLVSKI